jgi:hypothetical protein
MCVHRAHAMRQNKKSKFINNFTTTRRIVSYGVLTVENDTHNGIKQTFVVVVLSSD